MHFPKLYDIYRSEKFGKGYKQNEPGKMEKPHTIRGRVMFFLSFYMNLELILKQSASKFKFESGSKSQTS